MNFIRISCQPNTGSIFRNLSKSVALTVLTVALCGECLGSEPLRDVCWEQDVDNGTSWVAIDKCPDGCEVINVIKNQSVKSEQNEQGSAIYNIHLATSVNNVDLKLSNSEKRPKVQFDNYPYQICINSDIPDYFVNIGLAPAYIGLFCDESLRDYCGCSFGFYSDFAEVSAGRNITFSDNSQKCVLSSFRRSEMLRVTSAPNKIFPKEQVGIWRKEKARRKQVQNWVKNNSTNTEEILDIAKIANICKLFEKNWKDGVNALARYMGIEKEWTKNDENNKEMVELLEGKVDTFNEGLQKKLQNYKSILVKDCSFFLVRVINKLMEDEDGANSDLLIKATNVLAMCSGWGKKPINDCIDLNELQKTLEEVGNIKGYLVYQSDYIIPFSQVASNLLTFLEYLTNEENGERSIAKFWLQRIESAYNSAYKKEIESEKEQRKREEAEEVVVINECKRHMDELVQALSVFYVVFYLQYMRQTEEPEEWVIKAIQNNLARFTDRNKKNQWADEFRYLSANGLWREYLQQGMDKLGIANAEVQTEKWKAVYEKLKDIADITNRVSDDNSKKIKVFIENIKNAIENAEGIDTSAVYQMIQQAKSELR